MQELMVQMIGVLVGSGLCLSVGALIGYVLLKDINKDIDNHESRR